MAFHSKHKIPLLVGIFLFLLLGELLLYVNAHKERLTRESIPQDTKEYIASKSDRIKVSSPEPLGTVSSPLMITGEARGPWFFEASFPVVLTDWDGRIIAEHYASAQGEWMTEDFVPFESELQFESPYKDGDPDFMRRGTLILKKDNPSGLPENDDALEIPILFQ